MPEEEIKILLVPVGGEPVVRTIPNTLKSLQDIVGGYIEMFPLDNLKPSPNLGAIATLNEEGKLRQHVGIKPNRPVYHQGKVFDIFYGDFFICGADNDGNLISITPEQRQYYANMFARKSEATIS